MVGSDIALWAEEQWGRVCLGDRRRTRRAVQVGAAMAQRAGQSLPEQMECWPALKGSYRLFARPEVTHECLSAPHRHATRQASEAAGGVVLFIQDTTQLDFSHHPTTEGLGRTGRGHERGLLVHTTLAVSAAAPEGRLLGMADQWVWRRQGTGKRHQPRAQRLARPKESDVWSEALERIGPAPAGAWWVSVGDRVVPLGVVYELWGTGPPQRPLMAGVGGPVIHSGRSSWFFGRVWSPHLNPTEG